MGYKDQSLSAREAFLRPKVPVILLVILCYCVFGGIVMPRKREPIRGLWEREPGSDIWWIRYRVDGVLKREKVGAWGAAKDLLNKRKNEIREGIKMPENMRHTSIRFKTLCDDILEFSKKHHRDFRSVEIRVKKIVADFGEKPVDKIKPAEIDAWLSRVTKTPATSNRYRALFSLIFREALRNGKIASNPARLVRQRAENNGRIRFLTDAEETSLREAIRSRFPEHEAELTISLGTGMRLPDAHGDSDRPAAPQRHRRRPCRHGQSSSCRARQSSPQGQALQSPNEP
jgi:hypothetical protein